MIKELLLLLLLPPLGRNGLKGKGAERRGVGGEGAAAAAPGSVCGKVYRPGEAGGDSDS